MVFITRTISQKLKSSKDTDGIPRRNTGVSPVLSLKYSYQFLRTILKSVEFAVFKRNGRDISGIKCVNEECGRIIENAGITLRSLSLTTTSLPNFIS
ncbi:MAG: hypothetical protein N2V75_05310 [Methanophagales archaeon]|nr:hypothetical protein [Methanophagales archaeon]